MTGGLLIAAVTALLRRVLQDGVVTSGIASSLGAVTVSALPPDRIATGAEERPQINLFLHQVTPNTSLRNGQPSRPTRTTLDLHYLVTAYGEKELEIERLLGTAIQLIAATTPLSQGDIARLLHLLATDTIGTTAVLPTPDVAEQMARVAHLHITPQFLAGEELSRLWSALQARYRPSVGYKVSVVALQGVEA